jgi:hypothetical protein
MYQRKRRRRRRKGRKRRKGGMLCSKKRDIFASFSLDSLGPHPFLLYRFLTSVLTSLEGQE